jgi:hypothetical protein
VWRALGAVKGMGVGDTVSVVYRVPGGDLNYMLTTDLYSGISTHSYPPLPTNYILVEIGASVNGILMRAYLHNHAIERVTLRGYDFIVERLNCDIGLHWDDVSNR